MRHRHTTQDRDLRTVQTKDFSGEQSTKKEDAMRLYLNITEAENGDQIMNLSRDGFLQMTRVFKSKFDLCKYLNEFFRDRMIDERLSEEQKKELKIS